MTHALLDFCHPSATYRPTSSSGSNIRNQNHHSVGKRIGTVEDVSVGVVNVRKAITVPIKALCEADQRVAWLHSVPVAASLLSRPLRRGRGWGCHGGGNSAARTS